MGFEDFGTVSYTSQTKVNAFVDRLRQGKVSATRCEQCGAVYFPPRADCSACLSSEMAWWDIVKPGRLVSFSTLRYAPTGFEKDLPYTLSLVRFPEGLQAFGRLSRAIQTDQITIGMELWISPVELPGGRISYEFVTP